MVGIRAGGARRTSSEVTGNLCVLGDGALGIWVPVKELGGSRRETHHIGSRRGERRSRGVRMPMYTHQHRRWSRKMTIDVDEQLRSDVSLPLPHPSRFRAYPRHSLYPSSRPDPHGGGRGKGQGQSHADVGKVKSFVSMEISLAKFLETKLNCGVNW